jgi:hypothetical protein
VLKNKIEQDKFPKLRDLEIPDDFRNLLTELMLNGGLEKTRTSDLFRVKLAQALLLLLFPRK